MTWKTRLTKLWDSLRSKEYRDGFVSEQINSGVAVQMHEMRHARGMTQADLGKLMNVSQGRISRLEDPNQGTPNLSTLVRVASAFDCGLIVRFVPFSELARWTLRIESEPANAISFSSDSIDGSYPIGAREVTLSDSNASPFRVVHVIRHRTQVKATHSSATSTGSVVYGLDREKLRA